MGAPGRTRNRRRKREFEFSLQLFFGLKHLAYAGGGRHCTHVSDLDLLSTSSRVKAVVAGVIAMRSNPANGECVTLTFLGTAAHSPVDRGCIGCQSAFHDVIVHFTKVAAIA